VLPPQEGGRSLTDAKYRRYVRNITLRRAFAFLIGEPISKAFLSFECYCSAEELIRHSQM
jgi:hypothetical protein